MDIQGDRHQYTLQWRHNGRDSVSNHQPHDCLLNRLFRRISKKTSKLRVTGLCAVNPMNSPHKWPVTRKMFPFDDVIMIWHWSGSPAGIIPNSERLTWLLFFSTNSRKIMNRFPRVEKSCVSTQHGLVFSSKNWHEPKLISSDLILSHLILQSPNKLLQTSVCFFLCLFSWWFKSNVKMWPEWNYLNMRVSQHVRKAIIMI